jgi:hypothetical protein
MRPDGIQISAGKCDDMAKKEEEKMSGNVRKSK